MEIRRIIVGLRTNTALTGLYASALDPIERGHGYANFASTSILSGVYLHV